jgi:VCBS repeat-containing protein
MTEIVGGGTQKALTGGAGDDSLIGADTSENLNAGNGDDTIDGGGGDDKINGGAGIDTAVYSASVDDVTFSWNDSKLIVRTETEGTDSVLNVEKLVFGGTTYTVDGSIARSDTYLTAENQVVSLNVLSNDQSLKIGADLYFVDGSGNQLSEGALIATTAEGAEIRLGAGGALLFAPGTEYDFLAHGDTITRTFTYTIGNGIGGTSTALVTLTIQGTNDAPAVSAAVTGGGLEGSGTFSVSLLDHASDVDAGHTLHIEDLVWDESPGTLPAGFQLVNNQITVDANDPAYDSLAEGDAFTTHFTYYVVDEFGAKAQQRAAITITGKNDAATITGDAVGQVTENTLTTVGGTLVVNDVDTGENVFGAVGMLDGTYGTFTFMDGAWGYTLNNAANVQALRGSDTVQDTLTVKSKDGTATETIKVTVNGANDAATFGGADSGTVKEDETQTASGTLTVDDKDTGEASFQAATDLAGSYGKLSIDAGGNWTYTLNNDHADVQALNEGQSLTDSITVKSFDGTEKAIGVTIQGTDDAKKLLVDFEDVLPGDWGIELSDGYKGFNWDVPGNLNVYVLDENTHPGSGYEYGSIGEGTVVGFDPYSSNPINITRTDGSNFSLDSVYLTSAWDDTQNVTLKGFDDGNEVGSHTVTINNKTPTFVDVDWSQIDNLVISHTGSHLVMDNFSFFV